MLEYYDMNLYFIGCEISKEYFEAQEERFMNYTKKGKNKLGLNY